MDQLTTNTRVFGGAPIVCRGLTKRFAGVNVVDGATVTFLPGQIHGLVGQNGAGKSSLVKMLCGVYVADDGHVSIGSDTDVFRSPRSALERGVTMVAQELSLVPAMSVAENIFLGQAPRRHGLLNVGELHSTAQQMIDDAGFDLDPSAVVSSLPASAQQKVEILRALAQDARLIVLDEPTSSMSIDDSEQLYRIMRELAADGRTVVLVSHFLNEVLDVCDVITVMRDGRVVIESEPAADLDARTVVRHMTGEDIAGHVRPRSQGDVDEVPRLRVDDLSGHGFADVSLHVQPGEVVALVGLVGAGRSEFMRTLFGADRRRSGTTEIDGVPFHFKRPDQAVRGGVAMITESRKHDGIFPVLSTAVNITVAHRRTVSRVGVINRRRERRVSRSLADRVDVRAASIDTPISSLSGGNQQKALLARWLIDPPRLFLIDEPTRGVDVVSIAQIHQMLAELAAEGMSVLMVTSEFEEALDASDRIYVFRSGRVVAEYETETATKKDLLEAAFGTTALAS